MTDHRPSIVFILTDTQSKCMIGAYGDRAYNTPHLDALAAGGLRFKQAYTACPLCTPARGSMFSGMMPSTNGAWANEMSPMRHIPLAGERFGKLGYRAAYTGKWHLDGSGYHGAGNPDGGFRGDWWYDGKRYIEDIGQDRYRQLREAVGQKEKLTDIACTVDEIWGHRVADRAIDFLESNQDDPFLLVVSFDEPHGPFIVPPEFADAVDPEALPERPNFNASLEGKPSGHAQQASEFPCGTWRQYACERKLHWNCNAYVDMEIGRVVDAVRRSCGENTYIVYTADHGDMMGSHGLRSKGAMMYEETINIPLIISGPGIKPGVTDALASHLDLLPTFLTWAGQDIPECMQGQDLQPVLADPSTAVRETVRVEYNRFGQYHDGSGDLIPIRCIRDQRYKLVVNLNDIDELYDLQEDPWEMANRIEDPALAEIRNRLHDQLLAEMNQISDPFRGDAWRNRTWRTDHVETPYFRQPVGKVPAGLQHGRSQ